MACTCNTWRRDRFDYQTFHPQSVLGEIRRIWADISTCSYRYPCETSSWSTDYSALYRWVLRLPPHASARHNTGTQTNLRYSIGRNADQISLPRRWCEPLVADRPGAFAPQVWNHGASTGALYGGMEKFYSQCQGWHWMRVISSTSWCKSKFTAIRILMMAPTYNMKRKQTGQMRYSWCNVLYHVRQGDQHQTPAVLPYQPKLILSTWRQLTSLSHWIRASPYPLLIRSPMSGTSRGMLPSSVSTKFSIHRQTCRTPHLWPFWSNAQWTGTAKHLLMTS